MGGVTPSTRNFGSNWRRWSEIADFQYASAVTNSAKSSINTNRKFTTGFPMSLRWSSYVAPELSGGLKTQSGRFPYKIALRLKKLCYKVTLCENGQRRSCTAFTNSSIQSKLAEFRSADSNRLHLIYGRGFWIDISTVADDNWHWIDNSPFAGLCICANRTEHIDKNRQTALQGALYDLYRPRWPCTQYINSPIFAFFHRIRWIFRQIMSALVEDMPIMSVKYCFPVPVFHFWPKL